MSNAEEQLWGAIEATTPDQEALNKLSAAVGKAQGLETEIAMAEELLKGLKEQHFTVLTREIPELMDQAGTASFTASNSGLKVEVKTHVSGSLPERESPKRAECLRYVEDHGGAGIITADVVMKFGRSNIDEARKIVEANAERDDCAIELREDINHMTLKKFVREKLENIKPGENFEPEKCGVWVGRMAKITAPK